MLHTTVVKVPTSPCMYAHTNWEKIAKTTLLVVVRKMWQSCQFLTNFSNFCTALTRNECGI